MEPTNRDFELVYSAEELRSRIEELKGRGYSESDIHVLVEDSDVLGAADNLDGVQTHNAGSVGSKFKSLFTGRDSVREELKKLDLEQREIDDYQQDLEKGGILLYTDHALSRESDNLSAFGDDTRVLDSDEVNRNTALEPFGKDIEKDDRRHNDGNLSDKDIKTDYSDPSRKESGEIYTSAVPREEQYGMPNYGDEHKDSRLKGENIHPTTDQRPTMDESSPSEKMMEHEPALGTQEGNDNLNKEDGVNRRQDEQSPGVDPNLGPAPFGRDSEEEHLLRGENGDQEEPLNPDGTRRNHDSEDRRSDTPPTPKLF